MAADWLAHQPQAWRGDVRIPDPGSSRRSCGGGRLDLLSHLSRFRPRT